MWGNLGWNHQIKYFISVNPHKDYSSPSITLRQTHPSTHPFPSPSERGAICIHREESLAPSTIQLVDYFESIVPSSSFTNMCLWVSPVFFFFFLFSRCCGGWVWWSLLHSSRKWNSPRYWEALPREACKLLHMGRFIWGRRQDELDLGEPGYGQEGGCCKNGTEVDEWERYYERKSFKL